MPRQSQGALTLAHIDPRRLEPPTEFTEGSIERAIFKATVASVPSNHFQPEDAVLLAAYCRAASLERRASEELSVRGILGDRASPWLVVYAEAVRALSTLTIRLRLGPKARQPDRRRTAKATAPPSYYDLMPHGEEP
jgi:phage terminase small subunit